MTGRGFWYGKKESITSQHTKGKIRYAGLHIQTSMSYYLSISIKLSFYLCLKL